MTRYSYGPWTHGCWTRGGRRRVLALPSLPLLRCHGRRRISALGSPPGSAMRCSSGAAGGRMATGPGSPSVVRYRRPVANFTGDVDNPLCAASLTESALAGSSSQRRGRTLAPRTTIGGQTQNEICARWLSRRSNLDFVAMYHFRPC